MFLGVFRVQLVPEWWGRNPCNPGGQQRMFPGVFRVETVTESWGPILKSSTPNNT